MDEQQIRAWMDELIGKIEAHPKYGPAIRQAAQSGRRIVFDYHSHGPGQPFCLSIRVSKGSLMILGQAPVSEELAHIKGFGAAQDEGTPLMTVLAQQMRIHYELKELPMQLINGEPVRSS